MQAGQTGHYVLSTIHTIDSIEVITRLKKMGVSNYDISSTLATSVSQRLVRKVCPNCSVERDFNEKEIEIIRKIGNKYGIEFDLNGKKTYTTKGCKECYNTGYYGRIGIFEILMVTDEIKELIAKDASSLEIKAAALKQTYRPLIIDGIEKVLKGITTIDELDRKLAIF